MLSSLSSVSFSCTTLLLYFMLLVDIMYLLYSIHVLDVPACFRLTVFQFHSVFSVLVGFVNSTFEVGLLHFAHFSEEMIGRGGSSSGGSRYRNPCLTMHQPWASLLIHGIKKIEGRSWPAPLTGRLWIHAASKVPEPETIKAMENFYREIYAVDGITDIKFPEHYPVSRLLGCVEIVGCLRREELMSWEKVPQSVRLEGLTDFCWLCESPQKLLIPFEMRGYQGVYNLENRIHEAAVRGLSQLQGPLPVQFPLPDPRDSLSLKPGSLLLRSSKKFETVKSKSVSAAIAGARAAATQFSKKDESGTAIREQSVRVPTVDSRETVVSDSLNGATHNPRIGKILEENQALNTKTELMRVRSGDSRSQQPESRILVPCGTAKLFSEALRGMNSNR